jgi:hypothetical protein
VNLVDQPAKKKISKKKKLKKKKNLKKAQYCYNNITFNIFGRNFSVLKGNHFNQGD